MVHVVSILYNIRNWVLIGIGNYKITEDPTFRRRREGGRKMGSGFKKKEEEKNEEKKRKEKHEQELEEKKNYCYLISS